MEWFTGGPVVYEKALLSWPVLLECIHSCSTPLVVYVTYRDEENVSRLLVHEEFQLKQTTLRPRMYIHTYFREEVTISL